MTVFNVLATISGTNDVPEKRSERVIASGWQEVMETMSEVCRDTGCVMLEMNITQTSDAPFDYKTRPMTQ